MFKNQNTRKKQVNQRDQQQYGKDENFQDEGSQQKERGSNQQEFGKGQNYQEKGGSEVNKGKGIYGSKDEQEKMSYKGDQKIGQGGLDNSRMPKDSEYKAQNPGGQTNQHEDFKSAGSASKKSGSSFEQHGSQGGQQSGSQGSQSQGSQQSGSQGSQLYGQGTQGQGNQQSGSQGQRSQQYGQGSQNSQGRGQSGFQGKEQYGSQGSQGQEEQYGSQSAQGNNSNMYQVEEDKESQKWMVHPMSGSAGAKNDQWSVEYDNQNDANSFKRDLVDGKVQPPTQGAKGYKSRQSKGKTIYTRDSK